MAVTVKTIKKKPLALKKAGAAAEPAEPQFDADGNLIEVEAPVVVAAPVAPARPIKKASYTAAGVCAILSFLMFVAVLTLQIIEWKYYLAPPKSAFPPFGTFLPIPGGSTVSSVPVAEEVDFNDDGEAPVEEEVVPAEDDVPVE